MSPRKLTEDDKQEILHLYRTSEATTSTLANSYEVSSSTISRFLKNKLSSSEYEDLIQQKRLARTPRGEKSSDSPKKTKTKKKPQPKVEPTETETVLNIDTTPQPIEPAIAQDREEPSSDRVELPATGENRVDLPADGENRDESRRIPRRRRRSSAVSEPVSKTIIPQDEPKIEETPEVEVEEQLQTKLVLDKKTGNVSDSADASKSDKPAPTLTLKDTPTPSDNGMALQQPILKSDYASRTPSDRPELEDDDEDDAMDIITLKEMLGEDLEDINDDEDEDEDDDWEEEESAAYSNRRAGLSDVQILPLSQASFPRTCYLVIDRSAELIVKPLADFADLGTIPEEEVRQRTLPVFDNHRIAKRFSHRRERVIKVPDGRMLQKTSHHLQDKGITRLLIDGQIYSLST